MAVILHGNALAKPIIARAYASAGSEKPTLLAIYRADDAAALAYSHEVAKAAPRAGVSYGELCVTGEDRLVDAVRNAAATKVDGITVMTLPRHLRQDIGRAIPAEKDVDCINPENLEAVMNDGRVPKYMPCTPTACMTLLEHVAQREGEHLTAFLAKRQTCLLGRGLVGTPLEALLRRFGAKTRTYTSKSLPDDVECGIADAGIIIAAAGKGGYWGRRYLVTPELAMPGAVIIDIAGDVDPHAGAAASYYAPHPGGIGPVTTALLLQNTVTAAARKEQ